MPVFICTEKYLQPLYPEFEEGVHTWIDAAVVADTALIDTVLSLEPGNAIADEKGLIAGCIDISLRNFDRTNTLQKFVSIKDHAPVKRWEHPWQLVQWNDAMIRFDIDLQTKGMQFAAIPGSVNTIQPAQIFIEEGAKLSFCTLNAENGPIYIAKHAEIMEGSVIRGPFVLGENSVVKMNSRIYGATSLGPSCMAGGEIKNTVMMGFSNMLPRSGKHFSMPYEFGVAYTGAPRINVRLSGTACTAEGCFDAATNKEMQQSLDQENAKLNKSLSSFPVYPIVSLGLAYRF